MNNDPLIGLADVRPKRPLPNFRECWKDRNDWRITARMKGGKYRLSWLHGKGEIYVPQSDILLKRVLTTFVPVHLVTTHLLNKHRRAERTTLVT